MIVNPAPVPDSLIKTVLLSYRSIKISSKWPLTSNLQSAVTDSASLRRSGDLRPSETPAGGRGVAGSKEAARTPCRLWRKLGICGLFSRCVSSANDRVRLPPAL